MFPIRVAALTVIQHRLHSTQAPNVLHFGPRLSNQFDNWEVRLEEWTDDGRVDVVGHGLFLSEPSTPEIDLLQDDLQEPVCSASAQAGDDHIIFCGHIAFENVHSALTAAHPSGRETEQAVYPISLPGLEQKS